MIPDEPTTTGRLMKASSNRPPIEIDCSDWRDQSVSVPWTVGRFVELVSTSEATELNCSSWINEQRRWEELREIIESLQLAYEERCESAFYQIESIPSFMRILVKIAAKVLTDDKSRKLVFELLNYYLSGELARHGEMEVVKNMLGDAEHHGDDLCLDQLRLYGEQIIARITRDRVEQKQVAGQSDRAEEDLW